MYSEEGQELSNREHVVKYQWLILCPINLNGYEITKLRKCFLAVLDWIDLALGFLDHQHWKEICSFSHYLTHMCGPWYSLWTTACSLRAKYSSSNISGCMKEWRGGKTYLRAEIMFFGSLSFEQEEEKCGKSFSPSVQLPYWRWKGMMSWRSRMH